MDFSNAEFGGSMLGDVSERSLVAAGSTDFGVSDAVSVKSAVESVRVIDHHDHTGVSAVTAMTGGFGFTQSQGTVDASLAQTVGGDTAIDFASDELILSTDDLNTIDISDKPSGITVDGSNGAPIFLAGSGELVLLKTVSGRLTGIGQIGRPTMHLSYIGVGNAAFQIPDKQKPRIEPASSGTCTVVYDDSRTSKRTRVKVKPTDIYGYPLQPLTPESGKVVRGTGGTNIHNSVLTVKASGFTSGLRRMIGSSDDFDDSILSSMHLVKAVPDEPDKLDASIGDDVREIFVEGYRADVTQHQSSAIASALHTVGYGQIAGTGKTFDLATAVRNIGVGGADFNMVPHSTGRYAGMPTLRILTDAFGCLSTVSGGDPVAASLRSSILAPLEFDGTEEPREGQCVFVTSTDFTVCDFCVYIYTEKNTIKFDGITNTYKFGDHQIRVFDAAPKTHELVCILKTNDDEVHAEAAVVTQVEAEGSLTCVTLTDKYHLKHIGANAVTLGTAEGMEEATDSPLTYLISGSSEEETVILVPQMAFSLIRDVSESGHVLGLNPRISGLKHIDMATVFMAMTQILSRHTPIQRCTDVRELKQRNGEGRITFSTFGALRSMKNVDKNACGDAPMEDGGGSSGGSSESIDAETDENSAEAVIERLVSQFGENYYDTESVLDCTIAVGDSKGRGRRMHNKFMVGLADWYPLSAKPSKNGKRKRKNTSDAVRHLARVVIRVILDKTEKEANKMVNNDRSAIRRKILAEEGRTVKLESICQHKSPNELFELIGAVLSDKGVTEQEVLRIINLMAHDWCADGSEPSMELLDSARAVIDNVVADPTMDVESEVSSKKKPSGIDWVFMLSRVSGGSNLITDKIKSVFEAEMIRVARASGNATAIPDPKLVRQRLYHVLVKFGVNKADVLAEDMATALATTQAMSIPATQRLRTRMASTVNCKTRSSLIGDDDAAKTLKARYIRVSDAIVEGYRSLPAGHNYKCSIGKWALWHLALKQDSGLSEFTSELSAMVAPAYDIIDSIRKSGERRETSGTGSSDASCKNYTTGRAFAVLAAVLRAAEGKIVATRVTEEGGEASEADDTMYVVSSQHVGMESDDESDDDDVQELMSERDAEDKVVSISAMKLWTVGTTAYTTGLTLFDVPETDSKHKTFLVPRRNGMVCVNHEGGAGYALIRNKTGFATLGGKLTNKWTTNLPFSGFRREAGDVGAFHYYWMLRALNDEGVNCITHKDRLMTYNCTKSIEPDQVPTIPSILPLLTLTENWMTKAKGLVFREYKMAFSANNAKHMSSIVRSITGIVNLCVNGSTGFYPPDGVANLRTLRVRRNGWYTKSVNPFLALNLDYRDFDLTREALADPELLGRKSLSQIMSTKVEKPVRRSHETIDINDEVDEKEWMVDEAGLHRYESERLYNARLNRSTPHTLAVLTELMEALSSCGAIESEASTFLKNIATIISVLNYRMCCRKYDVQWNINAMTSLHTIYLGTTYHKSDESDSDSEEEDEEGATASGAGAARTGHAVKRGRESQTTLPIKSAKRSRAEVELDDEMTPDAKVPEEVLEQIASMYKIERKGQRFIQSLSMMPYRFISMQYTTMGNSGFGVGNYSLSLVSMDSMGMKSTTMEQMYGQMKVKMTTLEDMSIHAKVDRTYFARGVLSKISKTILSLFGTGTSIADAMMNMLRECKMVRFSDPPYRSIIPARLFSSSVELYRAAVTQLEGSLDTALHSIMNSVTVLHLDVEEDRVARGRGTSGPGDLIKAVMAKKKAEMAAASSNGKGKSPDSSPKSPQKIHVMLKNVRRRKELPSLVSFGINSSGLTYGDLKKRIMEEHNLRVIDEEDAGEDTDTFNLRGIMHDQRVKKMTSKVEIYVPSVRVTSCPSKVTMRPIPEAFMAV